METTTPFDLNRTIQRWRENLSQSAAFRSDNLYELETHLRDSIPALQLQGLSPEEAFVIATKRVGKGRSLETEFGKINGQAVWLDRFLWMLIGAQLWLFVLAIVGTISRGVVYFGLTQADYDFGAHGRGIPVALFIAANLSAFAGSLVFCGWLMCRNGGSIGQWTARILRQRITWAVTFGVLCLVSFSNYVINNFETTSILRKSTPDMLASISLSAHTANLLHFGILLALTLLLARKCLRMGRA